METSMPNIGIIGTAGRDKTIKMTKTLWRLMQEDLDSRLPQDAHLVSGGAAWADHLAVALFLNERCSKLSLYLPAPMKNGVYAGPARSSAASANFYHQQFSEEIGVDSRKQIQDLSGTEGVRITMEPAAPGFAAMFARNKKIAQLSDVLIAYTFGDGDEPLPGGTLDTWRQAKCQSKIHVNLRPLLDRANKIDQLEISKKAEIAKPKTTTKRFSFDAPRTRPKPR